MALLVLELLEGGFEGLHLGDESVLFQAHQHLLIGCGYILLRVGLTLGIQVLILFLLLEGVLGQFRLFLLHSSVINLLEISLLSELIIS